MAKKVMVTTSKGPDLTLIHLWSSSSIDSRKPRIPGKPEKKTPKNPENPEYLKNPENPKNPGCSGFLGFQDIEWSDDHGWFYQK